MRNQELQGYLIHFRKFREKSHIVHLFSQELGRIDGMLRHAPPPQYQLLRICATGKGDLKSFSQIEMLQTPCFMQGNAYFAGFYLHELLLRLLPIEEPFPLLFQQYQHCLNALAVLHEQAEPDLALRLCLRRFEQVLLHELGYALDFSVDAAQQPILVHQFYQFHLQEGFVPVKSHSQANLSGADILLMHNQPIEQQLTVEQLPFLAKLYRQMLSALLGDRPLKSRQLWIQQYHST